MAARLPLDGRELTQNARVDREGEVVLKCCTTASVFVRYGKVAFGEAGVTASVGVPGARGDSEYLGIGMHLYPVKRGRVRRNHVTTLMPPISAKGLAARLKRHRHYRPRGGPDALSVAE